MPHSEPPSGEASSIAIQLAIVLALVFINGFFVASEFALVSVRKTRVDQLVAEGSPAALVVQRALRDLDRYIAATQVGITIASLLLGGIGEKTFHHLLEPLFTWLPEKGEGITRGAVSIGLAYFIMTALHVVIGELMPKSIALQKTESTALFVGRPMLLVARLFTPLIWMLNGTGNFLLRRIGMQASEGHGQVHSPEELDLIFTQSHEGGELTDTERELLHRVVKFSEISARAIMVPRVEMKALPLEMPRETLTEYLHNHPHTRVPVYHGSMDDIIGIVHIKDLVKLEAVLRSGEAKVLSTPAGADLNGIHESTSALDNGSNSELPMINLMPVVREAARVPETIMIDRLLAEFKLRRQQMAIVIDEYGGTSGLVTMGDLLEQVFGDVHDEFDRAEPEIAELPEGVVRLRGRVLIDEVNERYRLGLNVEDADTMAGLVLSKLGRPAEVGDEVEANGARLSVEAIDRLRITSLLLHLPAEALERQAAESASESH
jgi:CBS domain containing-hemolysin-like protein